MLGWIAATTGGLMKDIAVGAEKLYDTVVEEISEVPSAFSQGLEHGLFTGPDVVVDESTPDIEDEEHDHHVDVEEHATIAEKHVEVPKFGKNR